MFSRRNLAIEASAYFVRPSESQVNLGIVGNNNEQLSKLGHLLKIVLLYYQSDGKLGRANVFRLMSNTRKRFSKYSNMEKWTGLNKKDVAYIFKLKFKY